MGMKFTFNGVSSDSIPFGNSTFDLKIATAPQELAGAFNGEMITYEGRYGQRYPSFGVYGNTQRDYNVSFVDEDGNLHKKIRAVRQWLYVKGYKRLEDDYDPDVYRLATLSGSLDFSLFENWVAQGGITFNCDPRRFLKTGETAINCSSNPYTLNNPYMESNPTILITASGAGTVTIGGTTIEILSAPGAEMAINTEKMTIMSTASTPVNLSDKVAILNKFPVLGRGNNSISRTGSVSQVKIIPNWWQP